MMKNLVHKYLVSSLALLLFKMLTGSNGSIRVQFVERCKPIFFIVIISIIQYSDLKKARRNCFLKRLIKEKQIIFSSCLEDFYTNILCF